MSQFKPACVKHKVHENGLPFQNKTNFPRPKPLVQGYSPAILSIVHTPSPPTVLTEMASIGYENSSIGENKTSWCSYGIISFPTTTIPPFQLIQNDLVSVYKE